MDRELNEGIVRSRFRDLEPFLEDEHNKAWARYVSMAPTTPLGHSRLTVTTTPAPIAEIPENTKRIHIYNLSEDTTVWFTDFEGQEPASDLGFPIRQDSYLLYDVEADENLIFATLAGTATLALAFYA